MWGDRFLGSEEVAFLSMNREVTLKVNDSNHYGELNALQKTLKGLEEKYEFRPRPSSFRVASKVYTEIMWVR